MSTLTEEQLSLAESVRDFCQKEVGSKEQRDLLTNNGREGHSLELNRKVAELGWAAINMPEEYGGSGGNHVDLCVLLEELARGMAPLPWLGTSLITGGIYNRFASEELKTAVLGRLAEGGALAIAMSEPGAGSDVAAVSCRADRKGDGWVINGQKTWITNAHQADSILLVARTSRGEKRHHGLTMFHVPTGIDGMEIRGIDTMNGAEVNDVFFTNCEIPADAVIGEVDQGWYQLMAGLDTERLILAAQMLGTAERAFDDCLKFVTERTQFGSPVGSFQAMKHRIADLATEIECARLLVYSVAAQADSPQPGANISRLSSMAKLKASEVAKTAALEGMQMMGGYGYSSEFPMTQHLSAALGATIYGGTNEIQREIIGRSYGL
ncbi:alkylation response protein AidB-like acyl-CoA dehydrogenase [Arthrobacter ginsengisoli]|uniref:Alkylation response protein AidB-like acyl-CoA dehydrogenase n=1 Tax=Arthrobacter ginsengisoli TaxID=1356565 RepID=A0ABU1UE03_9MICC|nr:acyl-CoA dehydrogenase family protein [Arthrobacter ginsengisoli]MDR7083360.1 alkylation response protein AidB-like acyl-CoA dehydrogenase [Arthrobacter ginsengisoli]